jgi:hypothetical protein
MKNNYQQSTTTTWVRESHGLLASWSSLFQRGLFTLVLKKLSSLKTALVRVGLAPAAIRASFIALVISSTVNSRVYVGSLLMYVMTPLAGCSYLLFDRVNPDKTQYYWYLFDLFLVISPYLSLFACMLGAYLWMPVSNRAKGLFIPMGLTLGKILWLMQVSSNEEFWTVPSISFIFYGLLIASLLPMVLDHLIWRKFHDFDGKMARLIGIVNISDMSEDNKKMLIGEIKKAQSFSF